MNSFITYDDKNMVYIDREAFHRELRNAYAEQNLPDEYRMYIEMMEDMYMMITTFDVVVRNMKVMMELKEKKTAHLSSGDLKLCEEAVEESEKSLEKWEQRLLHNK